MRLNNYGDTLVEVLMALAVTSLLISSAFTATNRSLVTARRSQERVEGLKAVESQLELLHGAFTAVGANTSFCLDASTVVVFAAPPVNAQADTFAYPANCQIGLGLKFFVSITRASGTDHTFTARSRWLQAGGGGTNEVVINYTVY